MYDINKKYYIYNKLNKKNKKIKEKEKIHYEVNNINAA